MREETKKLVFGTQEHRREHPLRKFVNVFLFLALYLFISVYLHGLKEGILISLLSWSFFVLCTPIADAGILIDFPARILFKVRMVYSEAIVWIFAISLNVVSILFFPIIYEKTILLDLLHHILTNPYPFWLIIILSAIGTFLSIHLGDEIIDITLNLKKKGKEFHKKQKIQEVISLAAVVVLTIFFYYFLLKSLGINKPLI